jgi:aromatic ring hydroxylase
MTREAARECKMVGDIAVPNTELVNIAKLHFATGYHQAIAWVQDIAGGLLVTGPTQEDIEDPRLGELVEKYLGGAPVASTTDRLRLMNLIAEITATDFAGYQAVLAIHAEGSIEAEKMTIWREHNVDPAVDYAKWLAGVKI